MPPKPWALERLLTWRSNPYICPTCQFRAVSSTLSKFRSQWGARTQHQQSRSRRASTVAPVTVVNALKNIPPGVQDLFNALANLERDASVYTNLSQLQLALRGLESENAVTRIAILGISGLHGVLRLARVLLADPLATESSWEKQLTDVDDDGRAILLRYGEIVDYDRRHPLLRTLTIPSSTLQSHKLEILIQAISPAPGNVQVQPHTMLVPNLEMQDSLAARYSVVRYPVHKTLVFGDGLFNLSEHSAITSAQAPESEMLKGAINTGWIDTLEHETSAMVVPINIDHAEAAITTFRQSIENSISYEHTWFSSGLPNLSSWLLRGLEAPSGTLKPAIRNLISSLLSPTESRILASETESLQTLASTAISPATRSELSRLLTAWSEKAHTELRDQLSLAFSSPSWRKLAWWKLPWRVDDAGMIASDVLQRSWLIGAEKELIWLVGRIEQAGLTAQKTETVSAPLPPSESPKVEVHSSAFAGIIIPSSGESFSISGQSDKDEQRFSPTITNSKYPQTLSLARTSLSSTTIPPLQSLAQKLVLYSLSTTLLTSSLSALVYISVSTTSLYEAGTIAALGLVYSLRRLQKRWEDARSFWRGSVREEGRRVLRDAEGIWRGVVEQGGASETRDDVGVEERRIAREAVAKVREAVQAQGR